jgi:3-phosphoshikimate 1-carboxyvinyltransferase
MTDRDIRPLLGPLDVELRATPSKSVTHRALIAAALASGRSSVLDPLDADDTRFTRDGLAALGVSIRTEDDRWVVEGCSGRLPGGGSLFLGESGTSMRFLTAVAALGAKPSVLDGAPRLRERPMEELASALREVGGTVELSATGGLPLRSGGSKPSGGTVRMPSGRSSQFASAMMLIAPRIEKGIDLLLEPPAVSMPYIEVTADVMRRFGAVIERPGELHWRLRPGELRGRDYRVDGDHSSASYFLASAALLGGRVRMNGLDADSAQPDARFSRILTDAGCSVTTGPDWVQVESAGPGASLDLEMGDAPDLVPTLAVLALFAEGPSELRGIAHLRHKESDRLEVLATNLRNLGRDAHAGVDRLSIGARTGPLRGSEIQTASDHRMAMAFAVAGLKLSGIKIDDPGCVAKSNPRFWEQFGRLSAP